jgi:hypothetical protein
MAVGESKSRKASHRNFKPKAPCLGVIASHEFWGEATSVYGWFTP